MTLVELEVRIAKVEQRLSLLASRADAPKQAGINSWIDQIHGTFQNDAAYKQAARLGKQWRKSQGGKAKAPRKTGRP